MLDFEQFPIKPFHNKFTSQHFNATKGKLDGAIGGGGIGKTYVGFVQGQENIPVLKP